MKAAVLREINKPLSLETLEVPKLNEGQVLVKLCYSGVCRSQIMELEGKRGVDKWIPHLLGHEGAGNVVAIGTAVSKVQITDRVGVSWLKTKGKDAPVPVYRSKTFSDFVNTGKVTTFSEYTIVPEGRVFKLPGNISTLEGVLFGCAIPTGAGMVLNECEPSTNNELLVYGLGGIGMSSLITLKALGCEKISVADIDDHKLQNAASLGVDKLFNLAKKEDQNEISKMRFDVIYEAAGTTQGIEDCFEMLKDEGTLIFASHPETGKKISLDPHELIKGKIIKGSWGGASDPALLIEKFSEMRKYKEIDLSLFTKNLYPLSEINNALSDLKKGKVLRPIIKFRD